MKVAGFTFVRNAVKYGYPVKEAILSILPLCDVFVVAVGDSEDATLDVIKSIDSDKIKIIETVWDDSLREGGRVLATETDKAYAAIPSDTDWAFYIQGDEVLHEKYYPIIRESMDKYQDNHNVEGLLFKYRHFYGSYDYIGDSYQWYRREIRLFKYNQNVFSYKDAQGFRKKPNEKLSVKLIDAYIHHYGWVREPEAMQKKRVSFSSLYHDDQWVDKHIGDADSFDYSGIDSLKKYNGTHPKVMISLIEQKNWKFDHDLSQNKRSFKDKLKMFVEKITGRRVGEYRNYKLV